MTNRLSVVGILAVAVLVFGSVAAASPTTIISTALTTIGLNPSANVYSNNYGANSGYGSYISSDGYNWYSYPNGSFNLTVPGVTLPAGSILDSATLTFSFPTASAPGSFYTTYLSPVDATYTYYYSCGFGGFSTCSGTGYNSYSAPSYSVTGEEYGGFTSVVSAHGSQSLSGSGSVNLLPSFSSDLLAGNALTLSGTSGAYLSWYYTYYGYNGYSDSYLYSTVNTSPAATLTVQYSTTPEPATFILFGTGLLLFGGILRKRLHAQSAAIS